MKTKNLFCLDQLCRLACRVFNIKDEEINIKDENAQAENIKDEERTVWIILTVVKTQASNSHDLFE